jgi:hypothetical protein
MNPILEFILLDLGVPLLIAAILALIALVCYIKYRDIVARETSIEPIVTSYRNAKVGDVLKVKL